MVHPTLTRLQQVLVTLLNKINENTRYNDVYEDFLELDVLVENFDNFLGDYYDDICNELDKVDYYMYDVRYLILELLHKVDDLIINYRYWV